MARKAVLASLMVFILAAVPLLGLGTAAAYPPYPPTPTLAPTMTPDYPTPTPVEIGLGPTPTPVMRQPLQPVWIYYLPLVER